ncbi:MAG: zinc-dependent alcohol dehydrogenase family protein [Polyangia bacterium]
MKACVLSAPAQVATQPLKLRDLPSPGLAAGEVRIAVAACAICRTDLHVVEGELPTRRSPMIPGHQVVGRVTELGADVAGLSLGQRVGVAWLHRTCGTCRFCRAGRENLCESADFTGWTVDGGFATEIKAPAAFTYPLPDDLSDLAAAPLLCAGIIGYRALKLTGIDAWAGARLGLYGFGAAGHIAIQVARGRGAEVYVCTRDRERHQALASELGATWVGGTVDTPPVQLDAAIIFAPAGEIVPPALAALDAGGTLVLGGIHMSPIPSFPYQLIYRERAVRSVANNTRSDGREFLAEAARLGLRPHVQTFSLAEANQALIALKHDAIRGAGVLAIDEGAIGTVPRSKEVRH